MLDRKERKWGYLVEMKESEKWIKYSKIKVIR